MIFLFYSFLVFRGIFLAPFCIIYSFRAADTFRVSDDMFQT